MFLLKKSHIKSKSLIKSQVQLASAKLAICLKNSVFGFEKPSFFRGLKFSFFATFLMYRSVKSLKFDFLGIWRMSLFTFLRHAFLQEQ